MTRYIGIFQLANPSHEHLNISDIISGACEGDYKMLPFGGKVVIYLFESNFPPHQLDFDKVLLAGDQHIFLELGAYSTAQGLGAFTGWLNSHRQK